MHELQWEHREQGETNSTADGVTMCARGPDTHAHVWNTEKSGEAKHIHLTKYGRRLHIFLRWGLVVVRHVDSQVYKTKLAQHRYRAKARMFATNKRRSDSLKWNMPPHPRNEFCKGAVSFCILG